MGMVRRVAGRLVSVCTAAMLLMAACGGSAATHPTTNASTRPASTKAAKAAAPAAPQHLTVFELETSPTPSLDFFHFAQDLGAFKKYGLSVTIKRAGASAKTSLLVAGHADVVTDDVITLISADLQGAGIKGIFVPTANFSQSFVANRSIQTMAQLKGKRIVAPTLQGAARFLAVDVLKHYGIQPNQVNWTVMSSPAARLSLIETNRVQGGIVTPADVSLIKTKYKNIHVLVPQTVKATGPFPTFLLLTTPTIIQKKGPALQLLVDAMLYTMRTFTSDPNQYAAIAHENAPAISLAAMKTVGAQLAHAGYWGTNGGVNLGSLNKVLTLYEQVTGQKPNAHLRSASQLVDTSFLAKALAKEGMSSLGNDHPDWLKK